LERADSHCNPTEDSSRESWVRASHEAGLGRISAEAVWQRLEFVQEELGSSVELFHDPVEDGEALLCLARLRHLVENDGRNITVNRSLYITVEMRD
jgi:hypothetical protein